MVPGECSYIASHPGGNTRRGSTAHFSMELPGIISKSYSRQVQLWKKSCISQTSLNLLALHCGFHAWGALDHNMAGSAFVRITHHIPLFLYLHIGHGPQPHSIKGPAWGTMAFRNRRTTHTCAHVADPLLRYTLMWDPASSLPKISVTVAHLLHFKPSIFKAALHVYFHFL